MTLPLSMKLDAIGHSGTFDAETLPARVLLATDIAELIERAEALDLPMVEACLGRAVTLCTPELHGFA